MAPPFWRTMAFVAVTAMLPATSRVVPFWMTPKSATVRVPAFTAMLPAGATVAELASPPLRMALPAPEIKAEPVAVMETSPPRPWNALLLIVAPPVTLRSPTLIAIFPPGAGPKAVLPTLPRSPRVSDGAEIVTAPPFAVGSLALPHIGGAVGAASAGLGLAVDGRELPHLQAIGLDLHRACVPRQEGGRLEGGAGPPHRRTPCLTR